MVPSVRPLHALYMFECFVYGQAACGGFAYPKDYLEYLTGADVAYTDDDNDAGNKSTFVASGASAVGGSSCGLLGLVPGEGLPLVVHGLPAGRVVDRLTAPPPLTLHNIRQSVSDPNP